MDESTQYDQNKSNLRRVVTMIRCASESKNIFNVNITNKVICF